MNRNVKGEIKKILLRIDDAICVIGLVFTLWVSVSYLDIEFTRDLHDQAHPHRWNAIVLFMEHGADAY